MNMDDTSKTPPRDIAMAALQRIFSNDVNSPSDRISASLSFMEHAATDSKEYSAAIGSLSEIASNASLPASIRISAAASILYHVPAGSSTP
jgi:hypothetical protein